MAEPSRNFVHSSTRRYLLCSVIFFAVLMMQSCYSSTAVKGTPVKDLALEEEDSSAREARDGVSKDEIARMSQVKGNKVFLEVDGISEYRIGPLDVLEIRSHVGDNVEISSVTVDNRGRISYSFIDDLTVSGLTPSQLDAKLTERLASYIRNPRIDILVKEFNSKSALVLGEFTSLKAAGYTTKAASGRIQLQGKVTIMDLIAIAGGYTVNADIKNTKLTRSGKAFFINLYDIIEKGDESLNLIIDDGDVLHIPEMPQYGERVYVMGEVHSQGIYALKDAQDLLAAISLADSFTGLAKEENTLVVREMGPGKEPLVIMADLKALLRKADLTQNIRLKDGDLVYVPRMLIGDINEWIENTMPLLNLIRFPARIEEDYFFRKYLHLDKRRDAPDEFYTR